MDDTNAGLPLNGNWYSIRYSAAAPAGLPPVIQAARILRYSDDTGTWLVALWDSASHEEAVSGCVLRVPADQVITVSRHADMGTAAREFLHDATAQQHARKRQPTEPQTVKSSPSA